MTSKTVAVLHSIALMPISLPPVVDFGTVLAGFGNPSLWQNLHYDGDGSWIQTGLIAGSICIAHDGSYMSEQSQELCSAGVVIYCRTSWQWLKAAAAISSASASNYRGDFLGAVMALLIIRAAGIGLTEILAVLHCDNRGVVAHGNDWV